MYTCCLHVLLSHVLGVRSLDLSPIKVGPVSNTSLNRRFGRACVCLSLGRPLIGLLCFQGTLLYRAWSVRKRHITALYTQPAHYYTLPPGANAQSERERERTEAARLKGHAENSLFLSLLFFLSPLVSLSFLSLSIHPPHSLEPPLFILILFRWPLNYTDISTGRKQCHSLLWPQKSIKSYSLRLKNIFFKSAEGWG